MHFSPFFSNKAVKIKPESFFWWKIVLICHIACPKWIKIVDFRGFLHFRAENPGFRVKILKLQFLQKGSMKNFKNCTKQTPTLYIFMGGMSCLCSWKKLISPQKPTVPRKITAAPRKMTATTHLMFAKDQRGGLRSPHGPQGTPPYPHTWKNFSV